MAAIRADSRNPVATDAVAERDHGQVERRWRALHTAADGRRAQLEGIERRGLEGQRARQDDGSDLGLRISHAHTQRVPERDYSVPALPDPVAV